MVAKIVLLVSCLCAVQAVFAKDVPSLLDAENQLEFKNTNHVVADTINTNEDFEAVEDFSTAQIFSEEDSDAVRPNTRFMRCAHLSCNSFCRNRGFHAGHCVNANSCRCYRFW